MQKHHCDILAITCIDFRIQRIIEEWLRKNIRNNNYDRVALAGGVFDLYSILRQVEISNKLHKIKKVILMNHEDCGAYGKSGSLKIHRRDLSQAEKTIEALYPHLDVETYYVYLKGKILELSKTNPRGVRK